MTCAVVRLDDGIVVNTIVAELSDLPPDGCVLVEVPEGVACNLGWTWTGSEFVEL